MTQARLDVHALRRNGIDDERHRQVEHPRRSEHFPDAGAVDVDLQRIRPPQHGYLAHIPARQVSLQGEETLRDIIVEFQDTVPGPEAQVIGQVVDIDGVALILDIGLAPHPKDAGEEDDGAQEIEQHTPRHHQQALPGRMGAELPRLRVPLEALEIHRLVHHPGNLAISAQREPADAVFRLGGRHFREEAGEPFLLGTEELDALDVEEEEKLLDPYAEDLGESEMTQFVQDYQHGQGQDHL